jgi:hypothetical protein
MPISWTTTNKAVMDDPPRGSHIARTTNRVKAFMAMVVLSGLRRRSESQGGTVLPTTAPLWGYAFRIRDLLESETGRRTARNLQIVRHHQVELFVRNVGRDGIRGDGSPLDEED